MTEKNNQNFPISVLTQLMLNRGGIEVIRPFLKTDKKAPNVRSIYNIPYTKDENNPFLQFDWHCPAAVAETVFKSKAPVVFYIHGGAWSSGNKVLYSKLCKDFAEQGYIVINMNFRFMPEYDMSTHYHDCLTCVKYCLNKADLFGIDRKRVFFSGDSSGAHMAALIGGKISAQKIKINCKVAGLLLFYGVYDLNNLESIKRFRICNALHDGFKNTMNDAQLKRFYHEYSPVTYISPNFPPCFMTAGKTDGLHTETVMLKKLLEEAKIPYSALIFPKNRRDARHAFVNLMNNARAEALAQMFEFMKGLR